MIKLTKAEVRQFLLNKQGLLGKREFVGKSGVLDYIRQTGSIQFDPVDVCGTSPELVLQSRVADFRKEMLAELLYQDRKLMDFFDKNLCIFPVEDWQSFVQRYSKTSYHQLSRTVDIKQIEQMKTKIRQMIAQKGFVFAKDLRIFDDENVVWDWGAKSSLARATLELMYLKGELIIHHKSGRQKSYAFAKAHLPSEMLGENTFFEDTENYHRQLLLRRIGAVGLLWNRPSDAWLGIKNFKAEQRKMTFQVLLQEKALLEVQIENVATPFYMRKQDQIFLENLPEKTERMEFLAPLDSLLWDRKLILEIFDFDYKWEIYTPQAKRKYGGLCFASTLQ